MRTVLIRERVRHKQRVEKVLDDVQTKLSSVATDIFGVSGRSMLEALIAGERDPRTLADLARGQHPRWHTPTSAPTTTSTSWTPPAGPVTWSASSKPSATSLPRPGSLPSHSPKLRATNASACP